jgi:two-component system nitrogen regulation response regulator NtrX
MTLATQAKLLRALENRTFKRVGGVSLPMDAAHHRGDQPQPADEVKGTFREDLYFRLNVVHPDCPRCVSAARTCRCSSITSRALQQRVRPPRQGLSGEALELLPRTPGRATCASCAT